VVRTQAWSDWSSTDSWRLHVCAVCEQGKFGDEMKMDELFTVTSLKKAICGVPVPGVSKPWDELSVAQQATAHAVGWRHGTWSGEEEPSDALCVPAVHEVCARMCDVLRSCVHGRKQWLSAPLARSCPLRSKERALADECGFVEGWRRRAERLRAQHGAKVVEQLRTPQDGRPYTTFCGFQLQADAVTPECRSDATNYVDEARMAQKCKFAMCKKCHSALCRGPRASLPKDAIANGNNYSKSQRTHCRSWLVPSMTCAVRRLTVSLASDLNIFKSFAHANPGAFVTICPVRPAW
jgi:hypothetical protein